MAIAVVDVSNSSDRVAVSHSNDVIEWQRELSVALRRAAEPREPAVLKVIGDGCLPGFEDPVIALTFLRDMQAALAELDLEGWDQARCLPRSNTPLTWGFDCTPNGFEPVSPP